MADWSGTGDVSTGSSSYASTDGDYRFRSTSSSSYRDASATGSINNNDLGQSNYGSLNNFKNAYTDIMK